MRTTHQITTKRSSFVALVMVITWLDFRDILLKTVILANLLLKFRMCFFKVKFRNSSISGIVGLIDVKWKASELIWYWADCMTLPFDHTYDLDLGVSRSESEIALSQKWGGWLIMNEKDVSHPFMTMILTCVTMVRWADVLDSDRGDFRRRCAIDISSLERCNYASME